MIRRSRRLATLGAVAAFGALAAGLVGMSAAPKAADKYKIDLSMSYVGNDWQTESANNIKAMAESAALKDKVSLEVQVAGPNAERQIQQINAMVQAGAKGIVIFPISPTAISNARTRNADRRSASTIGISASALSSAFTSTLVIGTLSGCLASDRCFRTSKSTSVAQR